MSDVLWVVRHGESTWNARGLMQRQIAYPPLTVRGMYQATVAGHTLRDKHIDRIVTSDAVRAMQTADTISGILGVPVTEDSRLRERGWAGNSRLEDRIEDPTERVTAALRDIAVSGHLTAIVTHGDIVCLLRDLLEAHDETTGRWHSGSDVPNGAVVSMHLGAALGR